MICDEDQSIQLDTLAHHYDDDADDDVSLAHSALVSR